MGRELYEREPVARAVLDRLEEVFREERAGSLLEVMFGDSPLELDRTEWTQPALYALQAALTELWSGVGVRPEVVLGHSVGEIAAARTAGVFGLEEGMRFAARRGALMGSLPSGGGMLAVFASEDRVLSALSEVNEGVEGVGLELAAENGTHRVVSGPLELLMALEERYSGEGVRMERLSTSHAFHSGLMDPVLEELGSSAEGLSGSPSLPLVSNLTGRVLGSDEELDGGYWRRQARSAVRFGAGVRTLHELGVSVLVEVGPRAVLGPLAALSWPAGESGPALVTSLGRESDFVSGVSGAYEAGLSVSFRGLYAGERRRRVSLPTYPFQRERYWVEPRARLRSGPSHPLLGVRQALASGEVVFETELTASSPVWLGDHRVFGQVVAPGVYYAAQAIAASGSLPAAAEEVRIERPLVLPEEGTAESGRLVQLVLGREDGSVSRSWEVFSRGSDEEAWIRHAAGRLRPGAVPVAATENRPGIERLKRELLPLPASELYRWLAVTGLELGPAFRGLVAVWRGDTEALGEIALPEGVEDVGAEIHPALLDASFQMLGGIGVFGEVEDADSAEDEGMAWLPVGWDVLWVKGRLPRRLLSHAVALSDPEAGVGSGEIRKADITLYTEDGEEVGRVGGLTLRRAGRSALLALSRGVRELLYETVWREDRRVVASEQGRDAAAEAGETSEAVEESGLWLLGASGEESRSAAEALAELLRERGQTVMVASGEEGEGLLRVDSGSRDSWRGVLEGLPSSETLRGVVHLEGLAGHGWDAGGSELRDAVEVSGSGALALVQGLYDAGMTPAGGVWLVTRGGQVVGEGSGGEPAGSVLWGFGRTVMQELSGLGVRLVDLEPGAPDSYALLVKELLAPDRETQVAYRGDRRLVARLVRSGGRVETTAGDRLRGDRSYLVTGGLGGIGIRVAGWLAAQGAGAIVLNGRRDPDEQVAAAISDLRSQGAEVRVEICDVRDAEAVDLLVAGASAETPLGGVIHSVGVLSDGAVANQNWERFERVLWPKVLGAWHLHRATLALDLDLFVLFSSLSGVLGNPGQANYAAANTFLDQLALHRRALGLPGQAIQWGAWSGTGEAEEQRERIEAQLEAAGMHWISPGQGLEALGRLVGEDMANAAVVSADWSVLTGKGDFPPPLLAELEVASGRRAASTGVGELVLRFREMPAAERERMVVDFVREEVRSALRLASVPPAEVGFFDLGMDSLMAVELGSRLNRALAGEYTAPNTTVFDYPNAAKLGRHLAEQLGAAADRVPVALPARRVEIREREDRIAIVGMACRFPGGAGSRAVLGGVGFGERRGNARASRGSPRGCRSSERAFLRRVSGGDRPFRRGVLPDRAGRGGIDGSAAAAAAGGELGGARGRGTGSRAFEGKPDRRVRGHFQ